MLTMHCLAIPLTAVQGMVKGLKVLVREWLLNFVMPSRRLRPIIISLMKSLKTLLELNSLFSNEFNTLMTKADSMITRQKSREY
jgi:hypothetical protein